MQSLKIEVLVGVFLLLSLLCLGFLAVKVSGFSLGKSNDRYLLYSHFEQVGGLWGEGSARRCRSEIDRLGPPFGPPLGSAPGKRFVFFCM